MKAFLAECQFKVILLQEFCRQSRRFPDVFIYILLSLVPRTCPLGLLSKSVGEVPEGDCPVAASLVAMLSMSIDRMRPRRFMFVSKRTLPGISYGQ